VHHRRLEDEPRQYLRRRDSFWKPFTLLHNPSSAVTISSPNSFAVTARDPSHSHNCRRLRSHSACHLPECLINYRCDQLHTRGGGKASATRAERRTPAHLPFLCVRSNLCVTAVIVFGSPATTSELASLRVRYQKRSSKIPDPCLQPRLHPPNGRARPAKSSN
jgi:hypothetical protein